MPDQGLTESDVRRWIGEASFERGQRYFQRGHILNPRRQGNTLKARCLGSCPQPYHVEVTLGQGGQLFIRVAQAAEESRLRAAIRIYMGAAERLIAARGRGNYATAATYLVRVRDLYRCLGEEETWQALIADLWERNRRLRALKDELNEAGL